MKVKRKEKKITYKNKKNNRKVRREGERKTLLMGVRES